MPKKFLSDFNIVSNDKLNESYFRLCIAYNGDLPTILPGQFAEIRVDGSSTTFLRRPISIHDVNIDKNEINLLINKVGDGTQTLSRLKSGDTLNMVYPLGNGFNLLSKGSSALLVGGGVGIAPLLYLGRVLKQKGVDVNYLLGFRSKKETIDLNDYNKYGNIFITTEDGSIGEKGFVTSHSILSKLLIDKIYACGPMPMMKAIGVFASKNNIDCEVSLETKMACGVGACLCCVTETNEGHKCVCTDGPIFNIKDLTWQK
ncbi:MAG: dihydroorotate dehydrogenase electron transfer subunit [Bacteroidia bacterium]|nr:dihydroorotate dehydrogenase electron transfer subunit [Bacteroidia bacterium]